MKRGQPLSASVELYSTAMSKTHHFLCLYWLLFCCCEVKPIQKQCWEKRFVLASSSREGVLDRECMATDEEDMGRSRKPAGHSLILTQDSYSEQEVRPGINPQNSVTTWGQLYEVWGPFLIQTSIARVVFSLVETTHKQLNTEYVSGRILWEKRST